jgi:hypothetical protein
MNPLVALRWRRKLRSAAILALSCHAFPLFCQSPGDARQLTITLDRSPSPAGRETLDLVVTIKNVSAHNVLVGVEEPLLDYSLTVTNCSGEPVPFSKRGKEYYAKDRIHRSRSILVTLAPGETHADSLPINDLYEFVRPGCYRLTARRDFEPAHETDSTNTLQVSLQ